MDKEKLKEVLNKFGRYWHGKGMGLQYYDPTSTYLKIIMDEIERIINEKNSDNS